MNPADGLPASPGELRIALLALGMPLALLLGGLLILLAGRRLRAQGGYLALLMMGLAFIASLLLLAAVWPAGTVRAALPWIELPGLSIPLRWRIDGLAALMLALVSGIAALVHLYSLAYLRNERHLSRYWAYLALFCAAMMGIVLMEHLIPVFMCWELVGMSSYLLIGFWTERAQAGRAAQAAFLVNRIGDAGLLAGILLLTGMAGSGDLGRLHGLAGSGALGIAPGWQTAIALLLFLGCMGKSAQVPLHLWLPGAMEGPTPVSALIHAATMVAAGVYLLGRIWFLMPPQAEAFIAVTGGATALLAALSALGQWDIKRVLAYSTISQLGLMMLGMGAGARDMALLHLVTHAFFKCALFLAAGVVVHAMAHAGASDPQDDPQDMRQMGGLRRRMPWTFALYLLPMLALSGLPLTSGFLSKDGILAGAWTQALHSGGWMWPAALAGSAAALLTPVYMMRQLQLIFGGPGRGLQVEDAEPLMRIPLLLLAPGSLWLLVAFSPFDAAQSPLLAGIAPAAGGGLHAEPAVHAWVSAASALGVAAGLWLGYRARAQARSRERRGLLQGLYLEAAAERAVQRPVLELAALAARFDRRAVDGLVNAIGRLAVHPRGRGPSLAALASWLDTRWVDGLINGLAALAARTGRAARRLQGGQVQRYLLYMLAAVLLAVCWLVWKGGGI
ncbi:MAG: NADH-quinone oxidoreductase subunit L [Bacteroidia bacterium]|nr:NADH-quinone oxidoreductase subunit L [Bacteroidia bacterium]